MRAYERETTGEPRSGSRRTPLVLLAVSAIACTAALACAAGLSAPAAYDASASNMVATNGQDTEGIRDALNASARESNLWISVAQSTRVDAGTTELYATGGTGEAGEKAPLSVLDNVTDNTADMRYTISLADTGEMIYESQLLAPGTSIEAPELTRVLEPGTHSAIVTGRGYDPETHRPVGGSIAAKITINVE